MPPAGMKLFPYRPVHLQSNLDILRLALIALRRMRCLLGTQLLTAALTTWYHPEPDYR